MRKATSLGLLVLLISLQIGAEVAQAHRGEPHPHSLAILRAATPADRVPNPPAGRVAIKLDWVFYPRPIPGAIRAYEPIGKAKNIWASETLGKGQPVPVGKEFKDSIIFVEPGKPIFVTLVYKNPTNADVKFYVVPHQVVPTSRASDTWLTCLCMSLIYGAPAGGAWYRTIGVGVSPETKPGTKVVAVHTVITDPALFPKE